jgi:hypothetical protein
MAIIKSVETAKARLGHASAPEDQLLNVSSEFITTNEALAKANIVALRDGATLENIVVYFSNLFKALFDAVNQNLLKLVDALQTYKVNMNYKATIAEQRMNALEQKIDVMNFYMTLDAKSKVARDEQLLKISNDRDQKLQLAQDEYLQNLSNLQLTTETYKVARDEYLRVSNEMQATSTATVHAAAKVVGGTTTTNNTAGNNLQK